MLTHSHLRNLTWGFCLLILVSGMIIWGQNAAAETVLVSFTVEPYTLLELPEPSISFSPVPPGSSVEQTIKAIVKANVTWELRISGTQSARASDGSTVGISSRIYAYDFRNSWEDISAVTTRICINQPPTDTEGVTVDIPLRLEADYNDPPGTYQTEIQLTLVPMI